jgi:hypothetical protein
MTGRRGSLTLLVLAGILSGCTQREPAKAINAEQGAHSLSEKVVAGQVVYLKARDLRATIPPEANVSRDLWDPSAQQGAAAYAALQAYLRTPDVGLDGWPETARQRIANTLPAYSLRITGITISPIEGPGRKLVNLEGVCAEAAQQADWRRPDFAVLDGGDCFFDAMYDPQSDAIVGFQPHGLA